MITTEISNTNPAEWSSNLQKEWINLETSAFSHYSTNRAEGPKFFEDFYLRIKDPVLYAHRREETAKHYLFRNLENSLVAYASYFLSDLQSTNDLWNSLSVNSIGIVARKMMAIPSKSLINNNGVMANRNSLTQYMKYIKENYYPNPTQFALLAHFQPDSLRLLYRLSRNFELAKILVGITSTTINGLLMNPVLIDIVTITDNDKLGGFAMVKFKL